MSEVPADPFNRGQGACRLGIPRDAVPYVTETLAYYHWLEGWDDWHYFLNPSEKLDDV